MNRRDFLGIVPPVLMLQIMPDFWQGTEGTKLLPPDYLAVKDASGTTITAIWSSPFNSYKTMGSGVAGYEIRIDSTTIVDVGNVLSHTQGSLGAGTTHQFEVRAYDAAGNRSAWSSPVTGTTVDGRTAILDTVTTPTRIAAFGFSKIKSSYGGSAVRVINTTTSVQTDVGFDASGNFDIIAAAALKTGAQVLEIVKYYDLTGGGNHVTAVGTRHVLDLSGHRACAITATAASPSIRYQSATTVNLTNPACFFVAEQFVTGQAAILDFGGGNQMQTRMLGGITISPVTKQLYMNNGTAIQSDESVQYNSTNSDGIRQFTTMFKSGNDAMRRDGIDLTISGTTNAGDTARSSVQICLTDFNGGGGLGWTGRFHEVIILDGTISNPDRNAVENDQMSYYQDGKQVIRFGDSLAYGQSLSNVYTDNFIAQLKPSLPAGWDGFTRGFAGFRIDELIPLVSTIIAPIIRSTARRYVFIVNGGTNDMVAGGAHTPAQAYSDMVTLVGDLKALGTNVEVYVMTNPRADAWGTGVKNDIITLNNLYAAGVTGADGIIDTRANTHIGDTANTSDATYYVGDQVHLTSAGYAQEVPYTTAAISF